MRAKCPLKQLLGQMWLQGDTLSQTSHMHKKYDKCFSKTIRFPLYITIYLKF